MTFAPRCLVAQKGWLCCGGESGEFVAIRLDDSDPDPRSDTFHESTSTNSVLSLLARGQWPEKSLVAKSMKLAKDRVNCITLWHPPTSLPACEEAYDEPVAVLANNDKTVTLVSLQDFEQSDKTEPLEVITYPDFVNRAVISPDGSLLVAILDDPYLYIHERHEKASELSPRSRRQPHQSQWRLKQRILLRSQRKDDATDSRGSFAACFSSSGAYLAVGTQHGTISIFDTASLRITGSNALITSFQSSRPQSGPGAVRDMAFCPGPYDILAWTEDRGCVGVTDVRSNFVVRQIVDIGDPSFEKTNVLDRQTIDPRLLESRRESGLGSNLGGSSDIANRLRRAGDSALETLNTPLAASETTVLEAMQNDRRRRERLGLLPPRSNVAGRDTTPGSWGVEILGRRGGNTEDDSPRSSERRSTSIGRGMGSTGDRLPPLRDQRERIQDRVRISRALLRDAAESSQFPRRPEQRWIESLGDTVAAIRDRQDSSYLTILEILQARDRGTGERDRDQDETSLLVPLVNQVVTRLEESAYRGNIASDHGVFDVPASPDNTAGLAWSEDGRIL